MGRNAATCEQDENNALATLEKEYCCLIDLSSHKPAGNLAH
jgi:hypothetical protein